ncbi:hypothetical protein [Streptomyces nanshensis]|uniref:hypothetical protein n=1 Tax=Streptomyces nanshensis TaxID=518642 RepID=UPI00085C6FFE|nr:hypothetical protein [Streptomyces nanshensis]
MLLAPHPLQRSGAWTGALLCGRPHPDQITDSDLDTLVDRIARDCDRAGRLEKAAPGWAWLVRLAGMYPQSPPVHPSRRKHPGPIGDRVRAFLGPDPDPADVEADGGRVWPCKVCGTPGASQRWGKDKFPLSDSAQHLNNSLVYGGGYPLCRPCRIAFWTLPYGTMTAPGNLHQNVDVFDEDTEKAVAAAHLAVNERALAEGWTSWKQAPAADDVLWQVLADRPGEQPQYTILRWTHGNQHSELTQLVLGRDRARRLAELHHRGEAEQIRRAARRAARTHPVTLATDPEQLDHALDTAPRWAADQLHRLDPDTPLDAEPTGAPHRAKEAT